MGKGQGNYSGGNQIIKGYPPTAKPGNGYQPSTYGTPSTPPSTSTPVYKPNK